jgi:hypothetical protein
LGTVWGRASGAQAPIDDLGLVDRIAVVVGCGQGTAARPPLRHASIDGGIEES